MPGIQRLEYADVSPFGLPSRSEVSLSGEMPGCTLPSPVTHGRGSKMNQFFPNLFSPIRVGNLTLKNRIINPGHGTGFAKDHIMTEQHLYYHRSRARGGVAMIITEAISIHPTSNTGSIQTVWGFDERNLPWYKRLSETVHEYGVPILGQLLHMGRQSGGGQWALRWAPSPMPSDEMPYGAAEIPHEMDDDEIQKLMRAYADCAAMVKEGGLDGVEIHAAGGNLIQQFLSPLTNQRQDHYGGSLENRLRFALEVIGVVRRSVGDDGIVGMRLSGEELVEGGLDVEDMKDISRSLGATGKLDYFNSIMGTSSETLSRALSIPPIYIPPAHYSNIWAEIKNAVDIPVIGVGRVNSPELAEKLIAEGKTDLVGMVRELIADPQLPNKAREGRADDIRPCVACLQSCLGRRVAGDSISCIHHPESGREATWPKATPAPARKKVLVVGGGPAGLEAARGAAKRGHQVILYERLDHLGGQIAVAARAPYRDVFGEITRYSERQTRKAGVEIVLGQEVTAELVLKLNPDAVVLATGSDPFVPPVQNGSNINLADVDSVLKGEANLGQSVLVVDTQGLHQGSDVAEYIAQEGKRVTIATTCSYVGANIEHLTWRLLFERLMELDITMVPFTGFKEIRNGAVILYSTITRKETPLEGVDSVVFASTRRANDGLYHALKGKVSELHVVGDCLAPRTAERAIYEGKLLGRSLLGAVGVHNLTHF